MIHNKVIFNPETFSCDYVYEEIEDYIINEIYDKRLSICHECENLEKREVSTNIIINVCGCCSIEHKLKTIYPVDDKNISFYHCHPSFGFLYVCPLKKW